MYLLSHKFQLVFTKRTTIKNLSFIIYRFSLMLKFLKVFLLFIVLYHILVTIICYGIFWWQYQEMLSIARDGIWIIFVLAVIVTHRKHCKWFLKTRKYLLVTLAILLIFSIGISQQIGKSRYDIGIGIKYGLRYIIILITAIRVGYSLALEKNKERFTKFLKRCISLLVIVVIAGFLRQIMKLILPEIFTKIGYGPLKDFVFGDKPPIYYLTGYEGTLRRQWIFSWPNNYGYFLIAFLPMIIIFFRQKFDTIKTFFQKNKQAILNTILIILWITAIIMTLSRTAFIGGIIGLALVNVQRIKQHKKIALGICIFALAGIVGLSILKWSSTLGHIKAKFGSIAYVVKQPSGYGLGTSGPAIHHTGTILPENYYLQLMLDIGTIGFLLRSVLILNIIRMAKKIQKKTQNKENIYLLRQGLNMGFFALLIMGIFLHVFEDSMVNYLFFIIWWILTGYLSTFIDKKLPKNS